MPYWGQGQLGGQHEQMNPLGPCGWGQLWEPPKEMRPLGLHGCVTISCGPTPRRCVRWVCMAVLLSAVGPPQGDVSVGSRWLGH